MRAMTARRTVTAVLVALALGAAPAHAMPIPEGPNAGSLPTFSGHPASARPLSATEPPRHPFMAPNGLSNLHVDAWQTDRNSWFGPLGRNPGRVSTLQSADCGSVTFDSKGRIVTVCVGLSGPRLMLLDRRTLDELARFSLPMRQPQTLGNPNPFLNFSGGGYFYLDHRDRAVIPTTTRHLWIVREKTGTPGFERQHDYNLTGAVPNGDAIISALPDWSGRIWFASVGGVLGTLDVRTGAVRSIKLGEPNGNSFAVDETRGVYVVTDAALYRFDAASNGAPKLTWRVAYDNIGEKKPGQTEAGSGTTPTIFAGRYVAITDNADPMDVVVYTRDQGRRVCKQPVFAKGAGSTDNSLIATDRSLVVENNYGYTGPASTENGATTTPGVERVDLDPGGGCHRVWHSDEVSPTVVPKLSLSSGLVYVYAKPARDDGQDAWYLTAIDFRSGRTVWRRLSGEGFGFNNNYAPVTLYRDGTAYVGLLGGLVRIADAVKPGFGPPGGGPARVRLRMRLYYGKGRRRCARGAVRARLRGPSVPLVKRADFRLGHRRLGVDRAAPFSRRIRRARFRRRRRAQRVTARVLLRDGRRIRRSARVRICAKR